MKRKSLTRQRLAALGLCGLPLLTYPLLELPRGLWFGLPASVVHVFLVWAGLIALAAWIAERPRS